jgi:CheY-like chemotaxis protein
MTAVRADPADSHEVSNVRATASTVPWRPGVLIVDDDSAIRRLASLMLKQYFNVYEAADGNEAIDLLDRLALPVLARHPIQVVLLDIMMPGVDGLKLCHRIKNEFGTKVIMCTAVVDGRIVQEAARNGADDYIAKPFSSATLLQKVAKQIRAMPELQSAGR